MKLSKNQKPLLVSFATLLFLVLFSQTGAADQNMHPRKHGPEYLAEVLGITEDQKSRFVSIMKAQHDKRMALHKTHRESREAQHEAMKSLHQETVGLLEPVLTATQLEEFEIFVENNRPPRRQ